MVAIATSKLAYLEIQRISMKLSEDQILEQIVNIMLANNVEATRENLYSMVWLLNEHKELFRGGLISDPFTLKKRVEFVLKAYFKVGKEVKGMDS